MPKLLRLPATATAGESYRLPEAKRLAGDPLQTVWNHYSSADGRFSAGVWASEAGAWRIEYTEYEYCRLLEGISEVTDEDGQVERFVAGDEFLIPRGFRGSWTVVEPTRKVYVIHEPGLTGYDHLAEGHFTVRLDPAAAGPAEGLARRGIDKQFHGDLEGQSRGEMLSGGDPVRGAAGYVAMEVVTGTLQGRAGSFALQHQGTMDAGTQQLEIQVVPGSGTGALSGLQGRLELRIVEGEHRWRLHYSLPDSD